MASDVLPALDALDLAVSHCAAVLSESQLRPAAELALGARRRRGFLGETVVMALAGGTGVGKSSLLNALAGEKVAETGVLRPITDRPLAWIPTNPEPGLVRLLDDLGIEDRIGHETHPRLAIIDLPDYDSLIGEHRATVDALLPRVDAVVWVVDPEKYNDRIMHGRYLAPLARYAGQFVFVLNQMDRLHGDEVDEVIADLHRTLHADGIADPQIFATAADPRRGPRRGLETLRGFLENRLAEKRVVIAKLLEDVRRAGRHLSEVSGVEPGTGLDFDRRWSTVHDRAVSALTGMVAGPQLVEASARAGRRLAARVGGGPIGLLFGRLRGTVIGRAFGGRRAEDEPATVTRRWAGRGGLETVLLETGEFVTDVSFETGGAFGGKVREDFGPSRLERDMIDSAESAIALVGPPPPPRRRGWWIVAAYLQLVLLLTLVGAGVWAWADPQQFNRGQTPWAGIVAAGAVLLMVVLSRAVAASGRRAGRLAIRRYRADIAAEISSQIDRRLGVPLRELIRDRALLAGALATIAVETAKIEAHTAAS